MILSVGGGRGSLFHPETGEDRANPRKGLRIPLSCAMRKVCDAPNPLCSGPRPLISVPIIANVRPSGKRSGPARHFGPALWTRADGVDRYASSSSSTAAIWVMAVLSRIWSSRRRTMGRNITFEIRRSS
jgi:hypothetical protein